MGNVPESVPVEIVAAVGVEVPGVQRGDAVAIATSARNRSSSEATSTSRTASGKRGSSAISLITYENPGLPTLVTTHAYVNTEAAANDYQHPGIFNKFVKNNPQIVMTFNGHLTGEHRVAATNIAGQTVQQMLVDYVRVYQ